MGPAREFRDRDENEVAVLEALIDRQEDGLTVFELRTHADIEIDELEAALGELKRDRLINVRENGNRTVILPDESVIPEPGNGEYDRSLIQQIRDKLPF